MPSVCRAQMDSVLFVRNYEIDPSTTGELTLDIDNVSFFKDNEWNGNIGTGYTLPGLWLNPTVRYTAIPEVRLEAGVHTLLYAGTTKYPNSIYQDIAVWKGEQYHEGTHIVPFFRANLQFSGLHFVLGNIYGGSNHLLPDPLYSAELNLTADPEMGVQMLYDNRRLHFDMWANWESFIFKGDYHRESFVFGVSTQYRFTRNLKASLSILAHHRGGEIDTITQNSVNTVMNGSVGLHYVHPTRLSWLRSWSLGADLVGYAQQSGKMWPIDKGWGLYAEGRAAFPYGLNAKVGYLLNRDFVSILSYPFYGCMSFDNRYLYQHFPRPHLVTAQLDWVRTFHRHYSLGVRAEMFQYISSGTSSNSLSFGIFLKANPSFLLWRKR